MVCGPEGGSSPLPLLISWSLLEPLQELCYNCFDEEMLEVEDELLALPEDTFILVSTLKLRFSEATLCVARNQWRIAPRSRACSVARR